MTVTFASPFHTRLDDGLPSIGYGDFGLDEVSALFGQSLKNMQVSPLHDQTTVLSAKGDDLIDAGGKRGKQ